VLWSSLSLDDTFDFLLVDLKKLARLQLHDALLELPVLLLKLPDRLLELLGARDIDFSRGLGIVRSLRIRKKGLL
jgi:hypothetical protein